MFYQNILWDLWAYYHCSYSLFDSHVNELIKNAHEKEGMKDAEKSQPQKMGQSLADRMDKQD